MAAGMGFDYFYGFMGGETNQWQPYLFRDHTQIYPWIGKPGYNLITDMADEAIEALEQEFPLRVREHSMRRGPAGPAPSRVATASCGRWWRARRWSTRSSPSVGAWPPWVAGGARRGRRAQPAAPGGREGRELPAKAQGRRAGDALRLETPGGGGWGPAGG